jgi:hypothetical protein
MTDTPRMTNQPDPDDEAWNDILELERELAAEAAGEPARVPTMTTEQLVATLSHNGLSAKVDLPARDWTVDEAHAELMKRGVTADHFVSPDDPIEKRWYPKK